MLMEQVEQKKKLISTMRNKPWRMVKKLSVLRYHSHQEPIAWVSLLIARCTLPFLDIAYLLLLL